MKKTQHGWCGSTRSRDIGRSAYLLHQSQGGWSLSLDRAQAIIGRPLTPRSVAGVQRRVERRATRRCAAGVTCPHY
jgi:hypothetical protein